MKKRIIDFMLHSPRDHKPKHGSISAYRLEPEMLIIPRDIGKSNTFSSFPNISLIVRINHALLIKYSIRAQKSDPIVTTGSLYKHHLSSHRSSFSTLHLRRLLYGQRACPSRTLYDIFIIT